MADPVSLAITVALNAATMAMTMMNKVEGPRLQDLSVSTADHGTPLAQFYGTKRLELPCIYAEPIREEKDQQKGKGGKYVEYKYFGTWASFIADHEIKAALKLWLDRHLVYDRTSSDGPILPILEGIGRAAKLTLGSNFRLHLGTEDQDPDPRLLATIEAREGAGMCPAYLGVAYAVFEDVPLQNFGNRLPQASGVFVRDDPSSLFPSESHARVVNPDTGSPVYFDNYRKLLIVHDFRVDVWNVQNRELISSAEIDGANSQPGIIDREGNFYSCDGAALYLINPYGSSTEVTDRFVGGNAGGCAYIADTLCLYSLFGVPERFHYLAQDDLGPYVQAVEIGFRPTLFFEDADSGDPMCCGWDAATARVYFTDFPGDLDQWSVATPAAAAAYAVDNGEGQYVVYQGGYLLLIDKTSRTLLDQVAVTGHATDPGDIFTNLPVGAKSVWIDDHEYSLTDLSVTRTIDHSDWAGVDVDWCLYDPFNHALITEGNAEGAVFRWRFLDHAAATATTLGDICTDAATQAGMAAGQFDFTNLDQSVLGFSWTQGPAKEIVGALLEIHDSDIAPRGFAQIGLKRGQALSGDSISSEWMVPEDSDDGDEKPLYRVPITAETDLPRRVWATFADPNMDEQPNTATAQRNSASVRTEREVSFDLSTLSIDPEDIAPMLERALRRSWVGAVKPECRLTPLEIRLEPGDVRHLLLDGERLRCRAVRTTIRANRVIDCGWEVDGETQLNPPGWESDDASPLNVLFSTPGAYTEGRPAEEVFAPVPTMGDLIDVALLRDTDDQTSPFVYAWAAPDYEGWWPGASVWVADHDEDDTVFAAGFASFSSDQETVWGLALDVLPETISSVIDYGSEIDVLMFNDYELSSISEDAMLEDQAANMAVIGGEVVQFRDAVLISTRRYRLSGFVRGARGTERAIDGHSTGERFVLIGSNVQRRSMGATEIGDTDYYKFATLIGDPGELDADELEFTAAAHRPLSPAHVELERNSGTGDWTISWVRRTRIGGATLNGQDVPLGESSELYRVKIMDGDEVVRTIEVEEEETTYTSAQQSSDWGSAQSSLSVQVVQVAPDLSLEGFETEASA